MNELAIAINTKATNDSTLMTAVDNDFYYIKAPADKTKPYCTFQMISDVPEYVFKNNLEIEDTLWQIDIWADSGTTAGDVADKVRDVFDEASLSITGYNNLRCTRENSNLLYEQDTEIYHYFIEYRIYAQKT